MLCEVSQIFFHVLILNAVYHLAFPTVEDELSGDRAVAVLGLGAFLLVDQMAVLLRDGFLAVLDLENPAGTCLRVKYHHVKFAHRELQDKNLLLGVFQLGFQQDNVFQHPSFDLGQDALLHGGTLFQRQGTERLIQQQTADQRIRLCIAQTGLGNTYAAGFRADIKIKGIMGYSMLLQTLQGKSILAHFSCPYALVVFKHHTIYRKNHCFIDRFCCRSLTAPYRCTFFLR